MGQSRELYQRPTGRLLRPKDVAHALGIGLSSARDFWRDPRFPGFKVGSDFVVVPEALEKWLEGAQGAEVRTKAQDRPKPRKGNKQEAPRGERKGRNSRENGGRTA